MKKNTGDKILDTALRLFNSKGLTPITLRTISKEMGISQGNLNYHYKKRDDIIEALYFRLVSEMDASMAKIEQSKIGIQLSYDILFAIISNTYNYRFIMADFTQIMRQNKPIRKHYIELLKIREVQIFGLINLMVELGLIRSERLENEYFNLYKRIQILSDFWIGSAEIECSRIAKQSIVTYMEIIFQSIYPYLTEKGMKEYELLKR